MEQNEATSMEAMEGDLMLLMQQLQTAQLERDELCRELSESKARELSASEAAEQSYVLVSEVQAKVREQIEEMSQEHRDAAATAAAEIKLAEEELLSTRASYEQQLNSIKEEAHLRGEALQTELESCEAIAASADMDSLHALRNELSVAHAEAELAKKNACALQSETIDAEATAHSRCNEQILVVRTDAEAEVRQARESEAAAKAAADARVAIAMDAALVADQARQDEQLRAEERLRDVRDAMRAGTAAQVDAAVATWKERAASAEAQLEQCRQEARDEVAEAQMQQVERVELIEKRHSGALERAAAAEGRISELLLQAASDAETINSLQNRLSQAEALSLARSVNHSIDTASQSHAFVHNDHTAMQSWLPAIGLSDSVTGAAWEGISSVGEVVSEAAWDSISNAIGTSTPADSERQFQKLGSGSSAIGGRQSDEQLIAEVSSHPPSTPEPTVSEGEMWELPESTQANSDLIASTQMQQESASPQHLCTDLDLQSEQVQSEVLGDVYRQTESTMREAHKTENESQPENTTEHKELVWDHADNEAERMALETNDHIHKMMREDMRRFRQRAGADATLARWTSESEWAKDTGGELARAQSGQWRELFDEVVLEETMRDSLRETEPGAPSLVIQLHHSKQLAQQQCQLLTQQNVELATANKALVERASALEAMLRQNENELQEYRTREKELQNSSERIAADLRIKTAETLAIVAREEALELNRIAVSQLIVAYFSKRKSREDVLGVLSKILRFSQAVGRGAQDDKIAVGLVTKWEVERDEIADKAKNQDSGFSFGDAWNAFLKGS